MVDDHDVAFLFGDYGYLGAKKEPLETVGASAYAVYPKIWAVRLDLESELPFFLIDATILSNVVHGMVWHDV